MRHLALFVLAISTFYGLARSQSAVGKYLCNTDAIEITSIVVSFANSGTPTTVYAVGKSASCGLGVTGANTLAFTGTGQAGSGYTATVSSAAADLAICGVTVTGTVASVDIIVQQHANVLKDTDYKLTFSCDGTKNEKMQTATAITVGGDATPGTTEIDIPLSAEVKKADDSAFTGNAGTLGDNAKIVATMSDTTKAIKECKFSAEASGAANMGNPVTMFDATGCSVTTDGLFANTQGKFTKGNAAGNTLPYNSANFKLFRFKDSNSLHIRVKCSGCRAADVANCAVTCTGGRKKRSAEEATNATSAFAITQLFVLAPSEQMISAGESRRQEASFTNCLNHVSFISVVAILALLLLISLGVSVFFCSKVLRSKEHAQKECYPNPAYKA